MPNRTADPISPVATLCLAILHRGEATGYEIKKESVEGDYSYFVDASYGAIYPALARLAAEGYVTQREVAQTGRPSRKVYAITPSGRAALMAALSEPPGPDQFRSRFLLVATFAAELPRAALEAAVAERRRTLVAEVEHLELLAARDDNDAPSRWIIDYGLSCVRTSLTYLDANAATLIAASEAGAVVPAASVAAE